MTHDAGMVMDGEGALRCSLYLYPKVLPVSPMSSTVHPIWSHLCLLIILPLLVMCSLSLGDINRFLMVLPPKVNLNSHYITDIPEALTQIF